MLIKNIFAAERRILHSVCLGVFVIGLSDPFLSLFYSIKDSLSFLRCDMIKSRVLINLLTNYNKMEITVEVATDS